METASKSALVVTEVRHSFPLKLRQPSLRQRTLDYVAWQQKRQAARANSLPIPEMPDGLLTSLNVDLTTACNYRCTHCIDFDMLNGKAKYEYRELRDSIASLQQKGLRSVILIGGGEPTVHPQFEDMVAYLKKLGLQVAIVSNGSGNKRILNIVDMLGEHDMVRLSLDSGSNERFVAMHKPVKPITLDEICGWIPKMRERNSVSQIHYSFIIVWKGAEREENASVIPNIDEMVMATERARQYGFSHISFKPFLTRRPAGAEVVDSAAMEYFERTLAEITNAIKEARAYETPAFKVIENTALRVLQAGTADEWRRQPHTCHKQAFQGVLSPLGFFNCPAHRGVPKARIAGKDAFTEKEQQATKKATAAMLERFDASRECAEVTCLYNGMNWMLENAIQGTLPPEELGEVPEFNDYFL